jgi:UDP-N-acetylmuramoyl-L-alanyl-D-glutamate--2,6-diaminopimelate ligase
VIRKLKNIKHLLVACLAVAWYRRPAKDLYVIGVTGTDGKTTTVELINHLLTLAGKKTAKISTLGAAINGRKINTGFHVTTPSPFKIQRLMRQALDKGVKFFVLEVTSHGLDQHRLFGCNFRVGVMTNVTKEHLDYHGSFNRYLQTKTKLFKNVRYAVLNRDDPHYRTFTAVIREETTSILSYGLKKNAYLNPQNFKFKTSLIGKFNQANALAAIAVAKIFEIPDQVIRQALLSFRPPPGRLEEIETKKNFRIFVDFAHTPGAFKKIIPAIRQLTSGRLIHVFGCTGDRDQSKRSLMGRISGRMADLIILTHEDNYQEDPQQIIRMIEPGVKAGGKKRGKNYWRILSRQAAIEKAVCLAKKGDVVLITGVGHQKTLNLGGKEVPWSDQEAVKKALRKV